MSEAPVMILAGGTGGHVFPALAVAEVLRERGVPVIWVGTRSGLESRVVARAGFVLETLRVRGLRGRRLREAFTAPLMLTRTLIEALRLVRRHRPRVVLGMGGYVSGPGALAARARRVPLVIHEQNAVAGMTNRWLARLADVVLTGFDATLPMARRSRFTGNPVRTAVRAVAPPEERFRHRGNPPRVLVIGGSLGAKALNEIVPQALARLVRASRPDVRHQAGERTLDVARRAYGVAGIEATVVPFIDDMAAAYAWADLVICRAGALTVAEIAAVGVGALLVPFPHAVDDHQTANARYLVDAEAALLRQERELDAGALGRLLDDLLADRDRLLAMAQRARRQGRPDAADTVAEICLEVSR